MEKEINRNDPCWCGSGKKYKYCHQGRDKMKQIDLNTHIKELNKAFNFKVCSHPEASELTCNEISKAHTIQKKSSLSKIAKSGKIYSFPKNLASTLKQTERIDPIQVGINEASIFKGFCNFHDNLTFSEVDSGQFKVSNKNAFLIGYRSFCQEIYNKRGALRYVGFLKTSDRGKSISEQQRIQNRINGLEVGLNSSLRRLEEYKKEYNRILLTSDYSQISYLATELDCTPNLLCSGVIQPEYNFQGYKLQDIKNLGMLDVLNYSIIATEGGGLAVFTWMNSLEKCDSFVKSYLDLPQEKKPTALVKLAFEYLSNVYFSMDWWDKIDEVYKDLIREHVISGLWGARDPNRLILGNDQLVDWHIKSIITNLINS